MIKLLDPTTNQIHEFKSWREAHYELDPCHGLDEPCEALRLDHYSDFNLKVNDFGQTIGKDCLLELYLEIAD